VAFSKNGLSRDNGKSVRKAIAKIEASGMIAFAKFPMSHSRAVGLDFVH
jgi:hypothetical protein